MNEEAGFIAALLAEPDDRTTLLVYADWLDERSDPRAEYLRLTTSDRPDLQRLLRLRAALDRDWVHLIDTRHFRVGSRVRIIAGSFSHSEGEISAITADRWNATVQVLLWGRPVDVIQPIPELERITAPASG